MTNQARHDAVVFGSVLSGSERQASGGCSGDSIARAFVLALGVAMLDTTRVSGRVMLRSGITLGKMAGFYGRRKHHIGNSVDSTVLENEKSQPLSEIFRSHFPIQVINMMGGAAAMASPRGMVVGALNPSAQPSGDKGDRMRGAGVACYAQVYLDGVRVYTPAPDTKLFDVNTLEPGALKGVEFFAGPGETPAQYSGTGASCGTLLLWTK